MKRSRGRPPREYNIRVRTVRRDPIKFEALARAALEQAAMDQRDRKAKPARSLSTNHRKRRRSRKEHRHDFLE